MLAEQTAFSPRDLLRRIAARSLGWIPDVTAVPRRRLFAIGAIVSLLFHVLVLLVFIVSNMVFPARRELPVPAPRSAGLEVELVPLPQAPAAPPIPKRRMMIDANGLEKSDEKPENAQYESDRDMVEGAEQPARGLTDLPSQQGRTDLPGQNFADQDLRLGVTPSEVPLPPDAKAPPTDAQSAQPAAQPVSPLYKPLPVAKEEIAKAETAKPVDQLPEPAKAVKATPPPLKVAERPSENALALLRSTPVPKVEMPDERAVVAPRQPTQPTATAQPQPRPTITDRFQANLRKTGVEGAITTPGKNGVNAINTPMGRYRRRMGQQIESLWNLKRQGHYGDLGGTVKINVRILESGRLERVQVVDDGNNPRHTEICLAAIREMRPEPMPSGVEPLLDNGALEITFSFTLY